MPERTIQEFTAAEYRQYLASGQADVQSFFDQQLSYAQGVQERLQAFSSLDDRVIRLQAEHRKAERARAEPLGRLYGVPVAVEDVIDTIDFPTTFGSPIHEGRYAVSDATVVRRIRNAGAVIFGKAETSEFAGCRPCRAGNPHDPGLTPGAASGGAAAAVAAGVAPFALALQSDGSVIQAASFCGVYGYTPSMGLVPRTGVFQPCPSLDRVGLFARCVEDLALIADLIAGDDGQDHATLGLPPRQLLSICHAAPPIDPKFCFVRTPWWDTIDAEAREAYEAFLELMRGVVVIAELPEVVEQAVQWHQRIHEAELAFTLQREYCNHRERLSDDLLARVEQGMRTPALDYLIARDRMPHVACAFDEYFEHYDAILSPAAVGGAPGRVGSMISPAMPMVWNFAGLPGLSMPLLSLSGGLPLGIQAAGSLHDDGRFLRAIRWLVNEFINRGRS